MKKGGESDGGGGRQKEEKWTVTINTYTQRKQKATKGRGQRRYDLAACRYEHTNLSERERERGFPSFVAYIVYEIYPWPSTRGNDSISFRQSSTSIYLSLLLSLSLKHFSGTKATVDHREMDVRFAWDKGCLDFFNIFGRLKKKVIVIQFIWDTWNDTWLFKEQNLNRLDSRS